MNSLLIKNARTVLSNKITEPVCIYIENGKIKSIGENSAECENVYDAKGDFLLAGFVDIHIHGGGGADFMDADELSFEQAVKSHLSHGTTTLVPTAMSAPKEDLISFIKAYKSFKKDSHFGIITPGVHLEGPYFSGANAKSGGAQPKNVLRLPDFKEIENILDFADGCILRWDAAPELENSEKFAGIMVENGIIPAIAHSDATSEETQRGIDAGFSHITHFYNAVTTYRKVGQKVLAGVVEAAYLNKNVTLELICDGRHIPRDILRLALMIKGADKVCAITDAMRISATDMESGNLGSNKNGTFVIVDDGVAKLPDLSSYAGSIATMDRCLKVLYKDYGIDLVTASKMLSLTPAKLIGLKKTGKIAKGYTADLVIADSDCNIKTVYKQGIQSDRL